MARGLLGLLAALLVLAAVLALTLYGLGRAAEPRYAGAIVVPGLTRAVEVAFDSRAVPSVRAESLDDLFFAQGYLVARERLWQMDLLRRLGRGRLAEVLGEALLPVDRLFRTLGLERAAQASLAALAPEVRGHLEAYSRGVNAYIGGVGWRLPLEYRLAGFSPSPWAPVDSLVVLEYMAFSLSLNARHELTFLKLAARIGPARARELFPADEGLPGPAYPPELEPLLGELGPVVSAVAGALAAATPFWPPGPAASNSWVLAGERTDSGLPLLANDPHLAPTAPSIWYEHELEAPGYHVAGLSLPGVPFVLIGHNEDLAWGLTTAMTDTQDLFLERAVPGVDAVERAGGAPESVIRRVETIAVRGRRQPERLSVRETSNGVILNDVVARPAGTPQDFPVWQGPYLLALRSSLSLTDGALEALYGMNRAANAQALVAAAHGVRHASQKVMFAHRDGQVGWYMTGAVPVRQGSTGAFPVPAWSGRYGWLGHLPPERNPALAGAGEQGFLVAANDRALPADYPFHVGSSWLAPYRARRIAALLERADRPGPERLAAIQGDVLSLEAVRYQQALERLGPGIRACDAETWALAREALLEWDGRLEPASASGAFLVLLRPRLAEAIFGDELGEDLQDLMAISAHSYNALQEVVASDRSSFWDDVRTPEVERPAQIWARALRATATELTERFGSLRGARLDRVRSVVFAHAFHWLPGLGPFFDGGPLGARGDDHTVSVMKATLLEPERARFVPSYRVVFTPGDWGRTRGTNTLGQSGHRFSPHRADQLADWRSGHTHPWSWGGPAPGSVLGRLTLTPAEARS